jgi:hypothetical protein
VLFRSVRASTQLLDRNEWVDRGSLGDFANFKRLLSSYPLTKYEWGMIYNTYGPEPVIVSNWNLGARLIIRTFVPHGDNAATFHMGTAMFTYGTNDAESKTCFCHRYVNHVFAPCCGCQGDKSGYHIYTRSL